MREFHTVYITKW